MRKTIIIILIVVSQTNIDQQIVEYQWNEYFTT